MFSAGFASAGRISAPSFALGDALMRPADATRCEQRR